MTPSLGSLALVCTLVFASPAISATRESWPSTLHAAELSRADSLISRGPKAVGAYLDSLLSAARAASDSDFVMVVAIKRAGFRGFFMNALAESESESRLWLPRARLRRDTLAVCLALRTIGYADLIRQRFAECGTTYAEMLKLARRARLGAMEGYARMGVSYVAMQDGRLSEAERGYRIALEKLLEAGLTNPARTARAGLANVLYMSARPEESRREYERVLADSRAASDLRNQADALNDLGAIEFQYGDPSLAVSYYREALVAETALGRDLIALETRRNLGLCLQAQGRLDDAEAVYDSVAHAAAASGVTDLAARSLEDLGELRRVQGRLAEAEATLSRLAGWRDSCAAQTWALGMTALARTQTLRGRPEDGRATARTGLDGLGGRNPPAGRAALEHALGEALIAAGEPAQALTPLRASAARRRGLSGEVGAGLVRVEADLARAFLALGRRDSALNHFRLASDAWERCRATPNDLAWREAYGVEAPKIYGAYAAELLDPARGGSPRSRAADAFAALQRFRSRTLEDALRGAEGRAVLPRVSLDQLQQRTLRPGELFIDVFTAPETTFVFFVDRDQIVATGAPAGSGLSARLRRFRDLLAAGGDPAAIASAATALGDALFGREAERVRHARTILISAGSLGEFSLGMLRLPGESDPIAALRRFALVPSATLLSAGRARPHPSTPGGLTVLSREIDARGRRLEGVAAESRWLGGRFRAAHVLDNDGSRSLDQMLGGLGPRDVLHVASHTRGSAAAPWRAGFLLGSGDGEDAYLTAARITRLPSLARVCVLAGCSSAGAGGGEGLPNLASAWLSSGANAVIATTWPVSDRATAALVRDFYEALAHGATTSDALMSAQRAARARGGDSSAEWGAFVLLGDPETRVSLEPHP